MPVEMLQVLLTLLYTQRILAVYHDFHCFHWLLVARKLLTTKLNSCYDKVSEILERSELVSDILHLTPQPLFLLRVTVNYRVSHRRSNQTLYLHWRQQLKSFQSLQKNKPYYDNLLMTALSKQNTAAFKKTVSASAADHEGGGGVCATIEVLVCNHAYLNYAFPDIW